MKVTRALRLIPLAVGFSTTLASCSGIIRSPLVLYIQPIQVCNDSGTTCAGMDLFEAATRKIWSQANIDVVFLTPNRLLDSDLLFINRSANILDSEFYRMSFTGGRGAFGRHPDSSRNSGPINVWFVDGIESSLGIGTAFGLAWVGSNGVLISDDVLDFNGGRGRLDTLAHEVGHNLGLRHTTLGAGGSNNLMTSGSFRAVPDSVDDITPDGARLDRLTSAQIDRARDSPLVSNNTGRSIVNGIIDLILSPDEVPQGDSNIPPEAIWEHNDTVDPKPVAQEIPETGFSGWIWAGVAIAGGALIKYSPKSRPSMTQPPLD